jgi:tRNA(adenine34) deaminase
MDHVYFMQKALALAKISLAQGEFPVGCVLIEADRVIVSGSRIGTIGNTINEFDHAEMIALKRLSELQKPPDPNRLTLYTTLEPCLMCFGALLISGIRKIVYAYEDAMGGATRCDLSLLPSLYQHGKISIVPNILRHESISLFKAFFTNPQNTYLKESFLAAYTLRQ